MMIALEALIYPTLTVELCGYINTIEQDIVSEGDSLRDSSVNVRMMKCTFYKLSIHIIRTHMQIMCFILFHEFHFIE